MNESMRGRKYRIGNVKIGNYIPIDYKEIDSVYPMVLKEILFIEDVIIRSILLHYITAFYHPFCDGNGRLSRFLMRNELKCMGNSLEILPYNYYLYNDVLEYYNLFNKVILNSRVDIFISYFINLIKYVLIHNLIKENVLFVDDKYKKAIDYINKYKIIGINDLKDNEELYYIIEELYHIGYLMKNETFYYIIEVSK